MPTYYRFRPLSRYATFGNALIALCKVSADTNYILRGRVKFINDRGWFVYRRFQNTAGGRWQQLTRQEGPYSLRLLDDHYELLNADGEIFVVAGANGSIPDNFNMRVPKTTRNGAKVDGNTKNTGTFYP